MNSNTHNNSKPQLTLKNVKSFFQATRRILYNKLLGLPKHIQEQVAYRHSLCQEDCFTVGRCKYCGCDPWAKAFADESCNEGERFPNLMNDDEWDRFKSNKYKEV
jgi:hypothetical protein